MADFIIGFTILVLIVLTLNHSDKDLDLLDVIIENVQSEQ